MAFSKKRSIKSCLQKKPAAQYISTGAWLFAITQRYVIQTLSGLTSGRAYSGQTSPHQFRIGFQTELTKTLTQI
ncbi:Uncharacterised protein [Enterobacter asburiae]|uniref:Uncharacterized protein n=1 Tax=Enterobacter asburiae TaxID=61645 RepID=A0A376FCB5_ENTAS|nr:Uncharacterised protein [Enterobacter asburiae]